MDKTRDQQGPDTVEQDCSQSKQTNEQRVGGTCARKVSALYTKPRKKTYQEGKRGKAQVVPGRARDTASHNAIRNAHQMKPGCFAAV
mmetsp:Transcript_132916/g.265227  ORF Transcript_132916/g.265227 Transcript_132916/m.265227 type:complete len:87 (-) Transcript_132916:983-1243(-)